MSWLLGYGVRQQPTSEVSDLVFSGQSSLALQLRAGALSYRSSDDAQFGALHGLPSRFKLRWTNHDARGVS